MKSKKILAVALVAILVAAMAFAYSTFSEKTVEGEKDITIEVVMNDGNATVYEVNTDAQYLIEAMQEAEMKMVLFSDVSAIFFFFFEL